MSDKYFTKSIELKANIIYRSYLFILTLIYNHLLYHQDVSKLQLYTITLLMLFLMNFDGIRNDYKLMSNFRDMIYIMLVFNPTTGFFF